MRRPGRSLSLEEAFLLLYAHLHGYEVPYTPDERSRVVETGGYLSHVGGLSPILKAAPFIGPDTVSGGVTSSRFRPERGHSPDTPPPT